MSPQVVVSRLLETTFLTSPNYVTIEVISSACVVFAMIISVVLIILPKFVSLLHEERVSISDFNNPYGRSTMGFSMSGGNVAHAKPSNAARATSAPK